MARSEQGVRDLLRRIGEAMHKSRTAQRDTEARLTATSVDTHTSGRKVCASRPGVMRTIEQIVLGASEEQPASKEDIIRALVDAFPDKAASGLRCTVERNLHRCLRERGHDIRRNPRGYYIHKGE